MADVEDRVLEELEAIQVRLGRVILRASDRVGGECMLWELGWLPMEGGKENRVLVVHEECR